MAADELHGEKRCPENSGISLVADQWRQRDGPGAMQRFHGAVLDVDLDIQIWRLLRIDRRLGTLHAQDHSGLAWLTIFDVACRNENRFGREAGLWHLERAQLQFAKFRFSTGQPALECFT